MILKPKMVNILGKKQCTNPAVIRCMQMVIISKFICLNVKQLWLYFRPTTSNFIMSENTTFKEEIANKKLEFAFYKDGKALNALAPVDENQIKKQSKKRKDI